MSSAITNLTTDACYDDPTVQMYILDPVAPIAGPLSGRLQSILEADEQTESAVEVIRQMTEALLWGEQNVSCHMFFLLLGSKIPWFPYNKW